MNFHVSALREQHLLPPSSGSSGSSGVSGSVGGSSSRYVDGLGDEALLLACAAAFGGDLELGALLRQLAREPAEPAAPQPAPAPTPAPAPLDAQAMPAPVPLAPPHDSTPPHRPIAPGGPRFLLVDDSDGSDSSSSDDYDNDDRGYDRDDGQDDEQDGGDDDNGGDGNDEDDNIGDDERSLPPPVVALPLLRAFLGDLAAFVAAWEALRPLDRSEGSKAAPRERFTSVLLGGGLLGVASSRRQRRSDTAPHGFFCADVAAELLR